MEANTVLNIIILAVVGIIGYFLKQFIADVKESKKVREEFERTTTKEINEIKFNYLDRFADIKESANSTKDELIKLITQSEKNLTKLITDIERNTKSNN